MYADGRHSQFHRATSDTDEEAESNTAMLAR
jgi:hypothetical protein